MITQTFKEAVGAVWSMVVGLKVTGKNFLLPQITVHYPRQVVTNLDTFRGHIELVPKDDDPFKPKCILCGQCENNCPSGCIQIESVTREIPAPPAPEPAPGEEAKPAPKPKKVKELTRFLLDYNLCSLCGLCAQNCPVDSLRFSRDVYLAGFSRGEFEFDLSENLKKSGKK
jgi:NADH-quinone oxidoreductase subunit I